MEESGIYYSESKKSYGTVESVEEKVKLNVEGEVVEVEQSDLLTHLPLELKIP